MKNIVDFDINLIEEMVEKKMLNREYSSDHKLVLYNYSNNCIYDKEWNKATLNLRGHIFEVASGNIVAMAFPKFFNLFEYETEERQKLLEKIIYKCYEKVDGVLGIIYYYDGEWHLNTRGRFDSSPAIKGLEILNNEYDLSSVNKDYTILVEILSQEFKIIIDYGEEKLVLLSAFDIKNDRELKDSELQELSKQTKLPIVRSYDYSISQIDEMRSTLTKDFEGFVIRFEDDLRIKVKSDEYMKVALLIQNLSPLSLWKNMLNGKVKKEVLILIPEEHQKEAKEITKVLEFQYFNEEVNIFNEYYQLIKEIKLSRKLTEGDPLFRKEMGLRIKYMKYRDTPFLIKDNKWDKLDSCIMQYIKPINNEFRQLNGN